jgi:hypothetical protein
MKIKRSSLEVVGYSLMWVVLIVTMALSCGHEVKEIEPIIINEQIIMWDSDHFVIRPQAPDTLFFVIISSIDDNTLELMCLNDSTIHTMIVESAYTPEYHPGITFNMIKP